MATEGKERVLSTSVRWAAGTERHRLAACKQQALFPQLWSRRSPRPRCWHCQVGAFSVLTGGGGRGLCSFSQDTDPIRDGSALVT